MIMPGILVHSISNVDVLVEGDGAETIVMIHGWPDTYRLWDSTVEALKSRYRCIRFTLPGFDAAKERRAYTLDELIGFLKELIERLCPGQKVILMLHDWGCFFGYMFYMRYPQMVSKIVGVDIGDPSSTRRILAPRERFYVLAYQNWLALAWLIGGRVGDWMTRSLARFARCPTDPRYMSSCMGYPYFVLWWGGKNSYRHHGRRFTPACPMLFVYGRRRPIRFHAKEWTDWLQAQKGSQVVEFDTGHWVMLNQPEHFNQVVAGWLSRG
jgi:pimeloyl-ACP methyl ester carboxylesterase